MNKRVLLGVVIAIVIIGGFFIYKELSKDDAKNTTTNIVNSSKTNSTTETNISNVTKNNNVTNTNSEVKTNEGGNNMYNTGKHHAKIEIKNYGSIELELDADIAPITVANFAKLVNEGFYNNLTFHRIIDGFMIQGGDPLGNGTGGSDENIKGEFSVNGVKNSITHVRGTISMARSSAFDSASSQFFIVHEDSTFLDGQYAGFGKVTNGMEIVDKICKETKVEDNNGTVLKNNQPIIEKIIMVD